MKTKYIQFYLLFCVINSLAMQNNKYSKYGFQKIQTLDSRLRAEQRMYRDEMMQFKKNASKQECYIFKAIYNKCPIDSNKKHADYLMVCSSCAEALNKTSLETQHFLHAEKALTESLRYSAERNKTNHKY